MGVLKLQEDGTYVASGPLVITCGCGSVVPDARAVMRNSGADDVPMVVSSRNEAVRAYVRQIGLDQKVPSLQTKKHAVLFNPLKGQYIDLLKVPHTQHVYENVRKVVYG